MMLINARLCHWNGNSHKRNINLRSNCKGQSNIKWNIIRPHSIEVKVEKQVLSEPRKYYHESPHYPKILFKSNLI